MADNAVTVELAGREVRVSNPDKIFFPKKNKTKLDLVQYYMGVEDGIVRALNNRPNVLKRYPNGAEEEPFFQKRVPDSRPDWINTCVITFPSGRTAEELCVTDIAHVIWAVNLGCIDFNPWAVRVTDLDHPDELRIDLDPQPGIPFDGVRVVANCVHEVFEELNMFSVAKTSGNRGVHIYVRITPEYDFSTVRRAALALGREVERRMPEFATTAWWKEERGQRVFIDYNQNARDRTVASAYSIRPNEYAMVSTPVSWGELLELDPRDLNIDTVPLRVHENGDPAKALDDNPCSLDPLVEWVRRDEAQGEGDAPWPPNFAKQAGEPKRVQPSRKKKN